MMLVSLFILASLGTTAVTEDVGWCAPDPPLTACPVTAENLLVNITIPSPGGKPVCQTAAGVVECSTLNENYPDIATVADLTTCKAVCLAAYVKDDTTCQAFTFLSERSGPRPAECFFLKNCEAISSGDPDDTGVPCESREVCVGGKICPDGGEDCLSGPCPDDQVCSEAQFCVDPPPPPPTCTAPQGIDYNHSPDISHWTNPCLKADGNVDADCNIYLNKGKCQEGTVCELKPECNGKKVTHTCQATKWMRSENGGDADDITDDNSKWTDEPCNTCVEPLLIAPEPGLSLICLNTGEPAMDGDKYKIEKGPCNMYCDGIYVHHIHCEEGTWKGDFNVQDVFYCWNKPTL